MLKSIGTRSSHGTSVHGDTETPKHACGNSRSQNLFHACCVPARRFTDSQYPRSAAALTTFKKREISQRKTLNAQIIETLQIARKTKETNIWLQLKEWVVMFPCQVAANVWGGRGRRHAIFH